MGITAALLNQLITKKHEYDFYVEQQNEWASKYSANSARLEKQTGYEEKYFDAYDDAMNDTDKELHAGSITLAKDRPYTRECDADAYARAKVQNKYDEELLEELEQLDMDYDAMQTLYEALAAEAKTMSDALTQAVQASAQQSEILQS